MEEADNLGDTIAILDSGTLLARGDPLKLKTTFGRGYTLSLLVPPEKVPEISLIVKEIIPTATVIAAVGSMTVRVPSRFARRLAKLFGWMESEQGREVVQDWGISNTTLEEVLPVAVAPVRMH